MDRRTAWTLVSVAVLSIAGFRMLGSVISRPPSSTALQSVAASPSSTDRSTHGIQFEGHVARGQQFEKDIGHGLIFQLTPGEHGWSIDIFPQTGHGVNDYSLTGIATPPYHGINANLQIDGWQFRNASNTGPNDGRVNAPHAERDFQFVMNEADARTVAGAIEQYEEGKRNDFSPNVPFGQGKLRVQNLKLGNLGPGSQAWIESMDLSVSLEFPMPTARSDSLK